jgi:putative transposase
MRQEAGGETDAKSGFGWMWRPKACTRHPQQQQQHRACPCRTRSGQAQLRSRNPDRLWVADITYARSWEGWLYLAFVLDAFSRRVVGWSMANHLRTELVLDALNMAIHNRRPAPGLVHHSDRGSQYTSVEFGKRLKEAELLPSMGSIADAFDNALAESFISTLKRELLRRHSWPSRENVRVGIFEYIECFYNPRRRHSSLGHLSPVEYEQSRLGGAAVA